jgi:hypothetical protein
MKKIIRLTESDLTRIVKRTIREMQDRNEEVNNRIVDKLFKLFDVKPKKSFTYARNLKYIGYDYPGDKKDTLITIDLDLKQFDEDRARSLINHVSWRNTYPSGFNQYRHQLTQFYFEYSINIFLSNNGEIIFRFKSSEDNGITDEQLEKSYTKEFRDSDEMFQFIESERLPELLSDINYNLDLDEYTEIIDKKQEENNYSDRFYRRLRRNGY